MSSPPRPWWYSGDDEVADGPKVDGPKVDVPKVDDPPTAASGLDWLSLLSGAQRMVDWATEKVMTPHAEHDDPSQHPDCLVCRTLVLIGPSGSGPGGGPAPEPQGVQPAAPIEWIPIRDAGTGTDSPG